MQYTALTSSLISTTRRFLITCLILATATIAGTLGAAQSHAQSPEANSFDPAAALDTFLTREDFPEQHARLTQLEQQVLQLISDEPLKLGSLGSAILDIYPGSLTGHLAMTKFYAHVDQTESLAQHTQSLQAIMDHLASVGDGTMLGPWPVASIYEAQAYAVYEAAQVAGAIYQMPDGFDLVYLLAIKAPDQPLQTRTFDISHLLHKYNETNPRSEAQAEPWLFIRDRARQNDSAAQTAIGAAYARYENFTEATGWLKIASSSGNVLASSLLARIYYTQSTSEQEPEKLAELKDLTLDSYMQAIALGSTEAMYNLANLYISNYYGEENAEAALPLLEQAAALSHTPATIYLGHLYNNGIQVEQDQAQAEVWFAQAAADQDPAGVLTYGRFLFANKRTSANPELIEQLKQLSADGNAEAMVVLGNLHARGYTVKPSVRQAVRWYKKAVKADPQNASIVNEVAWTLTVTDIKTLQRARYARRVMNKMMQTNLNAAARPEYLDTWAATHAANGNFERAVELQQQALEAANAQQRSDVIGILETHLALFEKGDVVSEATP